MTKLQEIEEQRRIHNELAPSQIDWLIERVKQLTEALEKCKIHSGCEEEIEMIVDKVLGDKE